MSSPLKRSNSLGGGTHHPPDRGRPQAVRSSITATSRWANLFTANSTTVSPSSSPSYLPDGTPVVRAPPAILLNASAAWTGYIVCRFFGDPPSPAKIFSDLNQIWGKHGEITVRRFSEGTCLVFVPSASTRKWILDIGLWSSGTVSFLASEWSATQSLAPAKLTSAPALLTIRGVPPQLWSQKGVEAIAGGVAELIPNARASLPLSSLGTAKIRATVPLGSPLSDAVVVEDSNGDSIRVHIDYGRLPPQCPMCKQFGHQSHRCPSRRSQTPCTQASPLSVSPSQLAPPQDASKHLKSTSSTPTTLPNPDGAPSATLNPNLPTLPKAHSTPKPNIPPNPINNPQPIPPNNNPQPIPPNLVTNLIPFSMDVDCNESLDTSLSVPITKTTSTQSVIADTTPTLADFQSILVTEATSNPVISTLPAPLSSPSNSSVLPDTLSGNMDLDSSNQVNKVTKQEKGQVNVNNKTTPITNFDTEPSQFSFPPLRDHSLDLKNEYQSSFLPQAEIQMIQPNEQNLNLKEKKEVNKRKRRDRLSINSSLRCSSDIHKFKPKGIVEKRRGRVNRVCVTNDDEVQECIQEMKADKKDSMLFEVLAVNKIMEKLGSET